MTEFLEKLYHDLFTRHPSMRPLVLYEPECLLFLGGILLALIIIVQVLVNKTKPDSPVRQGHDFACAAVLFFIALAALSVWVPFLLEVAP
jgi:hypothetical protein